MATWPRRPLWSAEKTYTKQQAADATYPDTGGTELTDLLLPNNAKASAGWVGWKNTATVQIDVDLGQRRPISFGQAWMLRRDADGIIQANTMELFGSNDGASWTSLGSVAPALADNTAAWVEVTCTALGEWRYVRFEIKITVSGGDKFTFVGELQVYGALFDYSKAQSGALDAGANCQGLYHMNKPNTTDDEPDYSGNGRTLTRNQTPEVESAVLGTGRRVSYAGGVYRHFSNAATGNIAWGTAATFMCWFARKIEVNALAYRLAFFAHSNYHHPIAWRCAGAGQPKLWWSRFNNAAASDVFSPDQESIPLNTFHHVAVTYDGATIRLYINGNLIARRAYTTAMTTSTTFRLGGDNAGYYYADGTIDELLAFTRVLSEAEIRWHVARRNGMVA